MADAIKVEIITRQIIKPSSPTPEESRRINLSFLDQMNFSMSTPVLLFYTPNGNDPATKSLISSALRSSLSNALSLYYPVAGIIVDNSYIDCNDKGVEYVEANVNCLVSDVLRKPDNDLLERLIPVRLKYSPETFTGAKVQVNFFDCGGFAIGIGLSPKIGDAVSLLTFIMSWSIQSLSYNNVTISNKQIAPHFVSDTIIPSLKNSVIPPPPKSYRVDEAIKFKAKRYVFNASKIRILQGKAASENLPRATRVEALTGFIWKCLMSISKAKSASTNISAVIHSVNLRNRYDPPLKNNDIGNLTGRFLAKTDDFNLDLPDLVQLLRAGLERTCEKIRVKELMTEFVDEFIELHSRDDVKVYGFTSLCRFPLNEADFGWGKPTWVTVTNSVINNYGVFTDARNGEGIEVWLSMDEDDFDVLERNQEFLEFASLNPSVIV